MKWRNFYNDSGKRVFKVDGKPFFPLGGQSSTSSAYNDKESEQAFKAVNLLHGNTLWTDVYWEHIEPEEGKFDFKMVDDLNCQRPPPWG